MSFVSDYDEGKNTKIMMINTRFPRGDAIPKMDFMTLI